MPLSLCDVVVVVVVVMVVNIVFYKEEVGWHLGMFVNVNGNGNVYFDWMFL